MLVSFSSPRKGTRSPVVQYIPVRMNERIIFLNETTIFVKEGHVLDWESHVFERIKRVLYWRTCKCMSASMTLTKNFENRNVKECPNRIWKYFLKSKLKVTSKYIFLKDNLKSSCKGKYIIGFWRIYKIKIKSILRHRKLK